MAELIFNVQLVQDWLYEKYKEECEESMNETVADGEKRILPDDAGREQYPLFDGLLAYFPAALCEVARWSLVGNNKHNPGEPLHWCREKSMGHENKIIRHLLDARQVDKDGFVEAVSLAWRALALCQTILEERGWPEGKNARWAKRADDAVNEKPEALEARLIVTMPVFKPREVGSIKTSL